MIKKTRTVKHLFSHAPRTLKHIACYAFVFFITSFLFAEQYTWTGAENTLWSNPKNWQLNDSSIPTTYPNDASDIVNILSNSSINIDTPVTVDQVTCGDNTNTSSISFTNSNNLTLNNINIQNANVTFSGDLNTSKLSQTSSGKIIVGGTLTVDSSSTTFSNCDFEVANLTYNNAFSCKSLTVNNAVALYASITTTGTQTYRKIAVLYNDISLIASTDKVIFSEGVECQADNPKSLTIGSTTQNTSLDVSVHLGYVSGATNKALNNVTVYGNFEAVNSASININGSLDLKKEAIFRGLVNANEITIGEKLTVGHATRKIQTTGSQVYNGEVEINTNSGANSEDHTFIAGNTDATGIKFTKEIKLFALEAKPNLVIGSNTNPTNVKFLDSVSNMVKVELHGNAEFSNNNTFENLVIGDKNQTQNYTVTFASGTTQTIKNISSNGNEDYPVLLTGTGEWTADLSSAVTKDFSYTYIQNAVANPIQNFIPDATKLIDYDFSQGNAPKSNGWFLTTYVWRGITTAWEEPSNWKAMLQDGTESPVVMFPDSINGICDIIIKSSCTAYPEIENDKTYKLKSLTIEEDAKITLSNQNLQLTDTAPLSNAGTIVFTNTGRIVNASSTLIMDTTQGVVEYSGSGTISNYNTDNTEDYNMLKITSGSWSIQNNTTIACRSTFENEGTLTLGQASVLLLNDNALDKGTISFTNNNSLIKFSGSSDITFECDNQNSTYQFDTSSKNSGNVIFNGSSETFPMQISGFVDAEINQNYFNNVEFLNDTTFNANVLSGDVGNITFKENVTFYKELKVANGKIDFEKNVTFYDLVSITGNLLINGNATINNTTVTTTGTQTYKSNVIISENATLTATEVLLKKDDTTLQTSQYIQTTTSAPTSTLLLDTPKLSVFQNSVVNVQIQNQQNLTVESKEKVDGTKAKITFTKELGNQNFSLTLNGDVVFNNNAIKSTVQNNGTLTCQNNVVFEKEYSTATTENAIFNASSNSVTFKENVDFSRNTFNANNGTIILEPSATSLSLDGSSDFNVVEIKGDVQVLKANIYVSLKAQGLENKTIIFPSGQANCQTISNTLILTGASNSDTQRLILKSSNALDIGNEANCFYINFTGYVSNTTFNIFNVDVQNAYNAKKDASDQNVYLSIKNSIDNGNNYWWNFPNATYTWTGGNNTNDWFEQKNWVPMSVPGKGASVVINKEWNGSAISYFPIVDEQFITLGGQTETTELRGTITIGEEAWVDFESANVEVAQVINNGKVYTKGQNTISGTKTNGDSGVVVYYGEAIEQDTWGGVYNNLYFGDNTNNKYEKASGEISTKLTVSGETLISSSSTNTLKLSSNENAFSATNGVMIDSLLNVELSSNGSLLIKEDSKCNSLVVSNAVTLENGVTTTETQTYNNIVNFTKDATLKASTLTLHNQTGTSEYSLTLEADVVFENNAVIQSKYVKPATTKDSNWSSVTATDTISITNDVYCDFRNYTLSIINNLSCKNFVMYNGNVFVAQDKSITTQNDFVVFGANYKANDTNFTGDDTRFAYYWESEPLYLTTDASYANNIITGGTYSSSLTHRANITLNVGKNFYVNGAPLSNITLNLSETPSKPEFNNTFSVIKGQWGTPYAVVFNSIISNVTSNKWVTAAKTQENTNGNDNTNVQFDYPQIQEAYTVYDDVIYIRFNIPLENNNNDINNKLTMGTNLSEGGVYYNGGSIKFSGAFSDAECTTSLTNGSSYSDFYIKSSDTWNTDATGTYVGADISTNRAGVHKDAKVDLSFLEGVFVASDGFTMCSNYGINGKTAFENVEDQCAPVLIAVSTGREVHKDPHSSSQQPTANQKPYDAHNFIEFTYSESVIIPNVADNAENIGITESLGNISQTNISVSTTGGATTNVSGIEVAGLAQIEGPSIEASSKVSGKPIHSLYRNFSSTPNATEKNQTHKIRVSIAGYVDGAITSNGKKYHNWTSYIESAIKPEVGKTVIRVENQNIVDQKGNKLTIESKQNHTLQPLKITKAGVTDNYFDDWDVTPPSFAPLRFNGQHGWTGLGSTAAYNEAVGAAYSGSSTLNAIEVHLFDNKPSYTSGEAEQWFTKIGWASAINDTTVGTPKEAAADIRGGIRYSSIYNLTSNFKYSLSGETLERSFATTNILGGAESSFFLAPNNANDTRNEDGCYIKLPLTSSSGHDPKSEFTIYFDAQNSYVTDLAGNLLSRIKYELHTVDRSSPAVVLTAAPCGKDELYIVFSKWINTDTIIGYQSAANKTELDALASLPKALELTGSSNIKIDDDVPARLVHRTQNATGFILKLNREVTKEDIVAGLYVKVKADAIYKYDNLAGITANVTLIQDMTGNYADAGKEHAFTDFAVNVIEPEFAYNIDINDTLGNNIQYGLYNSGSWAVHSWGEDQGNYGTLNPDYNILIKVFDEYTFAPTMYLSNSPDETSVSYEYNRISGRNWRIWLPTISANISPVANSNINTLAGEEDTENENRLDYTIDFNSTDFSSYGDKDTISFLFDTGETVRHDGSSSSDSPLYALRLSDINDSSSLDLWSIKLKSITTQRGNVSILNNVINPLNGEKAVVRLNMKNAGKINIMVMTLDGNIVTYLNRGEVSSGEQFFTWDGKNASGGVVARGMYFVRIVGNGIDETRKVMIVK